jgi:hypothetical protein
MHPFIAVKKDTARERIFVLFEAEGKVVYVEASDSSRAFQSMTVQRLKAEYRFGGLHA